MADELNRWLRAVRPPSAADDGWTDSPDADDTLAAIHQRIRPHRIRSVIRGARPHAWIPAAAVACVAALVVAVAVNSSAPGTHGSDPLGSPKLRPVAKYLAPFSSCDDLLAGLRTHGAAHVTAAGWEQGFNGYKRAYAVDDARVSLPAGAQLPVPTALDAAAGAGNNSTTNVQEIGIDEPDIVKTADGRVVTAIDGTLHVIDASTQKIAGSLDLRIYSGWQSAQLLVTGTSALVILTDGYPTAIAAGGPQLKPYYSPVQRSSSTVLYVDLAGTPKVTGTLHMEGQFVDARMVGSTARLVVSSQPKVLFPNEARTPAGQQARNKAAIQKAPLSAWLPTYSLTQGASTQTRTVPCSQVSHPKDYTAASMLTIYTVDPSAPGKDPLPISVAADGDTVYATGTDLYVASNPNWWCCPGPRSASADSTEIHRFDISGAGAPAYLGSGKVPGRLLSQYSLSDYGGQLRTVVSNGRFSSVYVLNADTLVPTGHVDGIGRGEQLYAVRFVGPLAYVVTFRQIDPLFVVDLRDPAHPKLAGELKMNGFSSYLHDAGNGRLIGVGQEATSSGKVTGLQLSLFDVSDPQHPTRTGQLVLKNRWGGERLDPHAFLYWQPTGLIAVPATGQANADALVARVKGTNVDEVGVVSNRVGSIARSLIVGGTLWTLSEGGIRVSDELTLVQQAWIAF